MAYRRCITTRAKQVYQQQQRLTPFSYITHSDDNKNTNTQSPHYSNTHPPNYANTRFPKYANTRSSILFQGQRVCSPFRYAYGSSFARNMSSSVPEKAEMMSGVDAFMDGTLETVAAQIAPAANEVAVAAADSFAPIAGLQFLIEYVHIFTGLNWWASIAATTVLIRICTAPLMVNQLKATSKFTLLRPKLEALKQEMQDRGMSPVAVSEGQEKMQGLFKEYKVTPFTPMKGALITGPVFICFFLAVQNMAQKVPSFQQGGAYWFLDLTTPDSMYILPVVTALTFLLTVELNSQEGMEGTTGKTIKNVCRVLAVLSVPMTASFAKAIFCYWITANFYSLVYGMVIKKPEVKKFLGIPIVPVRPPSPTDQQNSGLSFFETIKKLQVAAKQNSEILAARRQSLAASSPSESSEGMNQNKPSPAVLSQRIRSLEKEAKGKKRRVKKR